MFFTNFRGTPAAAMTLAILGLSACGTGTSNPGQATPQTRSLAQKSTVRTAYTPACPCEYVTNFMGGPVGAGSVTIYPVLANGNYSPGANVIVGSNTGLDEPAGIALDAASDIFVTNMGNSSVTVYTAGSSGNATPTATISGTNTGLSNPFGVALDSNKNIFVANGYNTTSPSVTEYATGATGNATPIRTIAGPNTGLSYPTGITLDRQNRIYVANANPPTYNGAVTVYSATANGNATPIQTITGPNTGLGNGAYGIVYHNKRVLVTSGTNQVSIFPKASTGNVTPIKSISGGNTLIIGPIGIAVGPNNRIFVTNNSSAPSVTVFKAYINLAFGNNNVVPVRLVTGTSTQLNEPYGVAAR